MREIRQCFQDFVAAIIWKAREPCHRVTGEVQGEIAGES